jgi:hypothetical protein
MDLSCCTSDWNPVNTSGRTLDHSTGVSVVAGGTVDPSAESSQKVRLHPFLVGQKSAENPCKLRVYARFYGIMIGIEDSEGTVIS